MGTSSICDLLVVCQICFQQQNGKEMHYFSKLRYYKYSSFNRGLVENEMQLY